VRTRSEQHWWIKVGFCVAVATVFLMLCWSARAQQASKMYRIGWLGNTRLPRTEAHEKAFLQGLRERGWIEGQNLAVERRYWERRPERIQALATDMVGLKLDVIVTTSGMSALALKKASDTVPIVMTGSSDAVTQGIVASLARPGGNVTGLTNISPDLIGKQLQLLTEAFPKISRVAALGCPASGGIINDRRFEEARASARALKLQLQSIEVNGPEEISAALRAAANARAHAVFVHDCSIFPAAKTVELVGKTKLPAIYPTTRFVEAGGVIVYGPSDTDLARRAAYYVDKILKGAKPADLPVEQPTKFELVINLKAAKQIGLTIPPNVLARADRVIK
jgi:putative tryptophan/tyrosine transport system substrate-binding protein